MLDEILEHIDGYIREKCEIEDDDPDYDWDAHLFDLGYLDSLEATLLLFHLEETYGITISQKDLVMFPMNTVREIARVVADKRQGN